MTGHDANEHILATNIDTAFMVTAADTSFDPVCLEQMLVVAHESGARPVVVLNKIDLCNDLDAKIAAATRVAGGASVLAACALSGRGVKKLAELIKPGDTAVFIGTSGVGKSSLINRLYGEDIQATVEVRTNDAKGRTTSWREMILLPEGGVVIDTPGREFHIWLPAKDRSKLFLRSRRCLRAATSVTVPIRRRISVRCSKHLPPARSRASGMTASSSFNAKFATSAKLRREPPGKTAKRAPVGPIALAARRIDPQLSSLRLANSYSTFQTI
jgi:ribosome small subunit-dependent GTPase A